MDLPPERPSEGASRHRSKSSQSAHAHNVGDVPSARTLRGQVPWEIRCPVAHPEHAYTVAGKDRLNHSKDSPELNLPKGVESRWGFEPAFLPWAVSGHPILSHYRGELPGGADQESSPNGHRSRPRRSEWKSGQPTCEGPDRVPPWLTMGDPEWPSRGGLHSNRAPTMSPPQTLTGHSLGELPSSMALSPLSRP